MTKDEVIVRFCELSSRVMANEFQYSESADCFCKDGDKNTTDMFGWDFQFSEKIIEFIEAAVREKLNK